MTFNRHLILGLPVRKGERDVVSALFTLLIQDNSMVVCANCNVREYYARVGSWYWDEYSVTMLLEVDKGSEQVSVYCVQLFFVMFAPVVAEQAQTLDAFVIRVSGQKILPEEVGWIWTTAR